MSNLEMMRNPNTWPDYALPVKRDINSQLECAVLMGNGPEVFLINIWDLPKAILAKNDVETIQYNSFEEIIEAGWIVD